MVRVGRIAAYFALGSLAAGTVFGLGFAINFRGDISARDEERRRRLGPSERFDLGEIYGAHASREAESHDGFRPRS